MVTKTVKFGGSSLATREQHEHAADIVLADPRRLYVVASAPGARYKGDIKVTDLLYGLARRTGVGIDAVKARIAGIIPDNARLAAELSDELAKRLDNVDKDGYEDNVVAFGEYANTRMLEFVFAKRGIPVRFVDPKEAGLVVMQKGFPRPDPKSYPQMRARLKDVVRGITVFPGFYGYGEDGVIRTFKRGGSDTSGACVARAVDADVYENFTDRDGLSRADPGLVVNPEIISEITLGELRELTYAGFKLETSCLEPLMGTRTLLNVRNTNNPNHPGTFGVAQREVNPEERIVGVAKQDSLVAINLKKAYIETEVGFGHSITGVLTNRGIPYEHHPNGVDVMSFVLDEKYLTKNEKRDNRLERVMEEIKAACDPDSMDSSRFSLVSVSGEGMKNHYDVHSRFFSALAREKIRPFVIDGAGMGIFVGVASDRADDAVRAIYNEFFG